ncbi:MAG TPA: hypothetical protein VMM93_14045 [Vicinamibacterales bacterium]|nr:hypothetical protein [Vicinamibacterales bacterium]
MRLRLIPLLAVVLVAATPRPATAGWDLMLFLGRAFPTLEERLTFNVPTPTFPGVDVNVIGSPILAPAGGMTIGAALTVEAGVVGLEARFDSVALGFDFSGVRYELTGVAPPATGLTGSLSLSDGRFDVDRLNLLSLNLRLRTPGPVGITVSGGMSFLPRFDVTGSVPIEVLLGPVGQSAAIGLVIAAEESRHRFGVNAGGGLRFGGRRAALVVEGRVFYFGDYHLTLVSADSEPLLDDLLAGFDPVRFRPVIVTAQAGLLFRF